jgi:hypothetical protein
MKRERKGLAGKGQCFSEEGLTGATACSLLALRALTTHPPRPPIGPPWGERAVRYRGDMNTPVASLDHLVGAGEQHRRHFKPERFRGL